MEYGRCADDGTNYDHEKQTAGSNDEVFRKNMQKGMTGL
jgi:hypothetical protein